MKTTKFTPVRLWLGALALGVTLLLGALPANAQIVPNPPANDNFIDAEILTNAPFGSVTGANVMATLEPGETNVLAGMPVGASVWYSWTCPAAGEYTFSTSGSLFDTILGVFTGDSVDALTLIGENDDFTSTRQSSVSFMAEEGVTYYLGVYGFDWAPYADVDQGALTLQWRPGGPLMGANAGEFLFTSEIYNMSDWDSRGISESFMDYYPAHAVITRANGSAGRVYVTYSVTNDWYTNLLTIRVGATNITLADGSQEFYTNYGFNTNFQHMVFGRYSYLRNTNEAYFYTNVVGGVEDSGAYRPGQVPTIYEGNLTYTANDNQYEVTYEELEIEDVVPSAVPRDPLGFGGNYDYIPVVGVAEFNTYQMSAWVPLSLRPGGVSSGGVPKVNPLLKIEILSAELDPLEEGAGLIPPSVSMPATLVNVHNSMVLPGAGIMGTNMFSFERSTARCLEDVRGRGIARLHVVRVSRDNSQSTSVPYRIDYLYPYANDHNLFGLGDEFSLQPSSDYASPDTTSRKYAPNADFTSVTGTVDFAAYDNDGWIDIPINNDSLVEFDEDLLVQLYFPNPQPTDKWLGYVHTCVLTIHFDEQPAGAVDRDHNKDNAAETSPPYNANPGANSTVYAAAVQSDNATVIAGDFTAYNTVPRNRLARMAPDGQLDLNFNPGDGTDQFIATMKLDAQERILIGGAFNSYNGATRNGVARVTGSGALDLSFDPGQGANGTVWSLAFAPNDQIYIAGDFSMVNATNRINIARLNVDGGLDSEFNPGAGPDGPVYAVAVDAAGKVYIGGQFTHVAGVPRSCIARLNLDGTLDTTFNPRSGVQGSMPIVNSIGIHNDRIFIGGSFDTVYGLGRNNLACLLPDGSIDQSFDPGTGTDDIVYTVKPLEDGRVLIGGAFTMFNQTRRVGLARLLSSGILDTTFLDTAYNQFAGIPTQFYNPLVEPRYFVFSTDVQGDGKVIIAGNFVWVGGGTRRDDVRIRHNVARLIGLETPGPGNIELAYDDYTIDNAPVPGAENPLFITMNRINGLLGPATVSVGPVNLDPGPGGAQPDVDYSFDAGAYGNPTWITTYSYPTWQISDGTWGQNNGYSDTVNPNYTYSYPQNDVWLNALNNTNRGNRFVGLELFAPRSTFLLGGEYIPLGVALGRDGAQVTIVDNNRDYGTLSFTTDNYYAREGNTNAYITVTRTGGSDNRVTVKYATSNLGATNGIHYVGVTNTLVFNAGVTNQTFTVMMKDRAAKEKNQTVALRLFDPAGGAQVGVTNATLTIVDNDIAGGYVEFSSVAFQTNESASAALVTVHRLGSSAGTLTVKMATANSNALAGVNYTAVSTNLSWGNNDSSSRVIAIPIIRDFAYQPTNYLTVALALTDPRLNTLPSAESLGVKRDAVLTILNEDYLGVLAFNQTDYLANENGGDVTITVNRTGGSAESVSVNYEASSLTAFDGLDFDATSGTLIFGPGEVSKSFTVRILDNFVEDLPGRLIALSLYGASPPEVLQAASALIDIIDDESISLPPGGIDTETDPALSVEGPIYSIVRQPDGRFLLGGDFIRVNDMPRNRVARLLENGSLDQKFSGTEATAGANDKVQAVVAQSDQRILIGGEFTFVNGVARNYLTRLMFDGSIDTSFNPGSGPESGVLALAETAYQGTRRILVGGSFITFNGFNRNYLVRLNDFGQVDAGFNPGLAPNGPVHVIVVDSEGRALIAGDFTAVNNVERKHIARILPSGELDLSFNPGAGANDSIRTVAIQMDGKILVGGLFTEMGGLPAGHVARLHANGGLDTTFNPGAGADDAITAIAVQPDGRILLAGQFTTFSGVTRNRLTRINEDGSVDTLINFGAGADSFVGAVAVQPDQRIMIGGGFTTWDGQPANHIARIYGGSVTGAGFLEFTDFQYQAGESDTNVLVTLRRRGGTSGTAESADVSVTVTSSDVSAIAGVNYQPVSTNVVFAPGETYARLSIPVMRDFAITADLEFQLELSNPWPTLDGPVLGNQQSALVVIRNDDSGINFSSATYSRNETAPEKSATITIRRVGSTRGTAGVDFLTTTNGTAVIGTNYWPAAQTVVFNPGQTNALVQVPLIYDPSSPGNLTVTMELTNAINALLFSPSAATLTIVDVDKLPGELLLSQTNYFVGEAAGYALITVVRTNGRAGTVTASFATLPGTAQPGLKYQSTNGVVVFGDNETVKSFAVPIIQNNLVDGHLSFSVALSG